MKQVKDVMTKKVKLVHPSVSIKEAAGKMFEFDIGMLPVAENEKIVGVLTDRDIAIRSAARGDNPDTTEIRKAMSSDTTHCYEDQSVQEAARIMKEHQIRRLIVLDRDNKLAGVCSLGDLAVYEEGTDKSGEVLEEVSKPHEK